MAGPCIVLSELFGPFMFTAPNFRERTAVKKIHGWVLGALAVLALGGTYYSSAYWGVNSLERAAKRNDLAAIVEKVDLPAVKENLKRNAGPGKSKDLLKIVGTSVATVVTGPLIDAAITPENVAKIIREMLDPPPAKKGEQPTIRPDAQMHYESLNRFVVDLVETDKEGKQKTTGIIFNRQGLFGWKLTSIEIKGETK